MVDAGEQGLVYSRDKGLTEPYVQFTKALWLRLRKRLCFHLNVNTANRCFFMQCGEF